MKRCVMKRRTWVAVAAIVVCVSLLTAAQSMPKFGTQKVLLHLPANFHNEELEHVLQHFVDREADVFVTTVDTLSAGDVAALTARIPERFFNLMPGLSGGPRVTVIPSMVSIEFQYDKVIFFGAGWYDEYFAASGYTGPTDPSYASGLYWFINRTISEHGIIGAIGAGVYPVIFSGALPPDASVPNYPCPDLITATNEQGYQPIQAEETPRPDGTWPPLVTVEVHAEAVNSATVFMTPIPNSWYPLTDEFGRQLVEDYTDPYQDAFDAIEAAYVPPMLGVDVLITSVKCGVDSVVTLRNDSLEPIDLAGWKLQTVDPDTDEPIVEYTFSSLVIEPGEEIEIYVGTSAPAGTPQNQTWPIDSAFGIDGAGRAVLVNSAGFEESSFECN